MKLCFFIILTVFTGIAAAQNPGVPIQPSASSPSGGCSPQNMQLVTPGGTIYTCQNGTWALYGGGGGGGVSSVSGPSIFTWATPTTTPTATINSQSANVFLASPNGSAGVPVFRAIVAADVPTLNQNTTGTAALATALAGTPTLCTTGQAPTGILANGNATGCANGGSAPAAKAVNLPYTLLSTDGPIIINAGNDGGTLTIPQATGSFASYNGSIYYTCAYPSSSGHQITLSTTTSVFNVANVNSSTPLLNCGYETSLRAVGGNWILGNLQYAGVFTDNGYTITWGRNLASYGAITANNFQTQNNCASAAAPAACGSAPVGRVVIAAGATTVQVNTTAVTAASEIVVSEDQSLGTALSVTCNTQALTTLGTPRISNRTAGTSFTISIDVGPTANPMCINYNIVN